MLSIRSIDIQKEYQDPQWKKNNLFNKWIARCQINEIGLDLTSHTKMKSNRLYNLNARAKIVQVLQESVSSCDG